MRDIDRIDKFCNDLAEIWKNNVPDWRFGQFMMNVLNSFKTDPWFLEEDEMIEKIRNYFNKEENNNEE